MSATVLVYCRDHVAAITSKTNADGWPDDVRLSDIEPNFTCKRCGKRGAELRPKFSQASMGFGKRRAAPFDEFDLFSLIKFNLLRLYSNSTCIAGIKLNADLKLGPDCAHSR